MHGYRRISGPYGSSRIVYVDSDRIERRPGEDPRSIEPERPRVGWIVVLVVAILVGRFVAMLVIR